MNDQKPLHDDDIVVVDDDGHAPSDVPKADKQYQNAREESPWTQEDYAITSIKSEPRPSTLPKEHIHDDVDAIQTAFLRGESSKERTFTGFSGLDHIDKLRNRRGILLLLLMVGCSLVVILSFTIPVLVANASIQVKPSVQLVRDDKSNALNPNSVRLFCERAIARKETWSASNQQYVRNVSLPYFAPEIRGGVEAAMIREIGDIKRNPKHRVCFILGSISTGKKQGSIYSAVVAYEIAVGIETSDRKSELLPMFNQVAELDVIQTDITDDNREGMTIIRMREYGEEEYLRLGGTNIWKDMRNAALTSQAAAQTEQR